MRRALPILGSALSSLRRRRLRRQPVFPLQSAPGECGVLAVPAAATMMGVPLCPATIRDRYGVGARGLSVTQLLSILRDAGFVAQAVLVDSNRPELLSVPAIALWRDNHFVTVSDVDRNGALIFDPEFGWARQDRRTVAECLSGPCIELIAAPMNTTFPLRTSVSIVSWLKRFQWKSALGRVLLWALLAQCSLLVLPLLGRAVLDNVSPPGAGVSWLPALNALALGLLSSLLFRSLTARVTARVAARLGKEFLSDLCRRLFAMPLAYLSRTQPALLASKAQTGSEIQDLLVRVVGVTSIQAVVGLIALILVLALSPQLGLLVLAARLVVALVDRISLRGVTAISERRYRRSALLHSTIIELFQGAGAIKTNRVTDAASRRIETASSEAADVEIEYRLARQSRVDLSGLVTSIEQLVFLYVGATLIGAGVVSIGTFYAVIVYKDFAVSGFRELLDSREEFNRVRMALTRIEDVVAPQHVGCVATPFIMGDPTNRGMRVTVDSLGFAYGSFEPLVFDGLSLEVEPGECVAIVGPSGAGKSTLAKLLTGALRPSKGRILFDDVPLSATSEDYVFAAVASVMQSDHLITGSIKDNIDFFRGFDLEAVRRAAEAACIDSFIMSMPMRYETPVSDLFGGLSGGQRQRLLIARALVGHPRLLIMDEATSFLDVGLEAEISTTIASLDMTRIIFAHRQETIRRCDRIITLSPRGLLRNTLGLNTHHTALEAP